MKSLIFTVQEGHYSIAKAVESFLQQNNFDTEFIFKEEASLKYYKFFYQHAPGLFKPFYQLTKTRVADVALRTFLRLTNNSYVQKRVEESKPQFVFNTSLSFSDSIKKAQKKNDFQFINIVPNPRTFFNQDLSQADITCVFDEQTKKDVLKVSPNLNVIITGWFVQKQFEAQYDKKKVRQELGLDANSATFLLVTGSEGTETICDLLLKIARLSQIQLVVACGTNDHLLKKVTQIAQNASAKIKAVPFTTQIYKYMQAADLVIGKAGPNMIFEAVATHTPFFATTHITGLEDGNLDLIREYRVGFVEENPDLASQKIIQLIEHPEELEKIEPNVASLCEYNRNQKKELLKHLQITSQYA